MLVAVCTLIIARRVTASTLKGNQNGVLKNPGGLLLAPPHDGKGHTWHHDDQLLFDYTKLGGKAALEARDVSDFNSGMPAFDKTLTDDEIWDILAYIRSTWSQREQEVQASRTPKH